MFDAGLFEMLVIFTLGLLVLGPERLPRVARFVGRWVGQARRAVTNLNNEIERELALEEIRRVQRETSTSLKEQEQAVRDSLGAAAAPQAGGTAANPDGLPPQGDHARAAGQTGPEEQAASGDDAADRTGPRP
jgi:sec-independent protein translocase protein TatB